MRRILTLVGLAALGVSQPALSAVVVDQNQTSTNAPMAGIGPGRTTAQTFTTSASNVAGAGIMLWNSYSPQAGSQITFGLWSAQPNHPGAVQLATSTVSYYDDGGWVDAFWSPVAVNPGSTYFLTFNSNVDAVAAGSTANPYSNGMVFANHTWVAHPNYDYTFRTYTDNLSTPGAVPEPATWAMFLMGFGAVGYSMRSRKVGYKGLQAA